jgi:hypothetical protein
MPSTPYQTTNTTPTLLGAAVPAPRASAVQAATAATTGTWGFDSHASVLAVVARVNEVVATLTELKLWKGGA